MKFTQRFLVVIAVLLLAVSAFGQTTGKLTGTVTLDDAPLPGATVTITSPALQGSRTAYTDVNGNYTAGGLPPGQYTVVFEMESMGSQTRAVNVTLSGTARADATMRLAAVAEAITVTASAAAVLETTEVQQNIQQELINDLPIGRTVNDITLLAPGVTSNGPRSAIQISGAVASDNLIMVDGAVIQENLRGQTHGLFIEDAIQETTVITGAVSAEYGRFTGGVVNSITKSGGNEFTGSLRDSFNNPSWQQKTPFPGQAEPVDVLSEVYEATFGGRIIRDRLWFFAAGRQTESTDESFFRGNGGTFPVATTAERYEGKVTGAVTPRHTLVATYLDSPLEATNNCQLGCYEFATIDPSITQANDFRTAHYNGILSNKFLLEGGYSQKKFQFVGFGGDDPDQVNGTPIIFYNSNFSLAGTANAPYFCGSCEGSGETRDNENYNVKGTYYLGTKNFGTHNIVAGYDDWTEFRNANNYQSPSLYVLNIYSPLPTRAADGSLLVSVLPGQATFNYYPILKASQTSDLTTDSIFLNDKWDLNGRWSFNIGARYDKNESIDQAGNKAGDDAGISPRLGIIFDPMSNGRVRFNASYSQYVGRMAEGVQGAGSDAGSPASYLYSYEGPEITNVSSNEAVRRAFQWFNSVGGRSNADLFLGLDIGGFSTRVDEQLKSPHMNEYTVGGGFQIGSNSFLRADLVHRDFSDFYVRLTNLETGPATEPTTGAIADRSIITNNSDDLSREYNALQLQTQTRLFQRVNLGLNYTLSELKGNAAQENVGNGPIWEGGYIFQYPEFQGFAQNNPEGSLGGDQTHKVRAWASFDLPTPIGSFNFSVLERFDSGTAYSAIGNINPSTYTTAAQRAAYVGEPTQVAYYFSDRGEFRWDDIISTDLALNYSLPPVFGVNLFVNAELFNAFNADPLLGGFTTVLTQRNATCIQNVGANTGQRCAAFNPFTETPVEGVHWRKAETFGTPSAVSSYNTTYFGPRFYRFSVGLRF